MYSDNLEQATNRSIKDRLNCNIIDDSSSRRPVSGKRRRQEDKLEHNLFKGKPQLSRSEALKLGARDLRLKLQKRSTQKAAQSGGVRDLREKLTGSMHAQPLYVEPPKPRPTPKLKPGPEASRRIVIGEAPLLKSRKVSIAAVKKSQQKAYTSIDELLQSLGLEKYQVQFQAEEVDITALDHMADEDLKTMGLPMGPRKKILSALASRTGDVRLTKRSLG